MTDLIASYESQLTAVTGRIDELRRQRQSAGGNISFARLTERIERLEEVEGELETLIGEMKQHL